MGAISLDLCAFFDFRFSFTSHFPPNLHPLTLSLFAFSVVSPPVHHHTHTYPGVATASPVLPTATMVTPGVPVVNSGGLIDTSTVHHIHHIPGRKSKSRRDRDISDSEESDSDEGYPAPRRYNTSIHFFVSSFEAIFLC